MTTIDPLCKLSVTSGLVGFVGMFAMLSLTQEPAGASQDDLGLSPTPPESVSLTGVVRDFRERTATGGHPDFEKQPNLGWGHYVMNVAPFLGESGKPVFVGTGRKVAEEWTDREGRPICWCVPSERRDDPGRATAYSTGGIESEATFNQWFRDVPGTNLSQPLELTLHLQDDGTYVFDDTLDPQYSSLGGFFPIEGELFGNPGGSPDRNFHFTFELHTRFTYNENIGQNFRFVGDDDVFVYIDGKLVIDLGGVHPAIEQYVDLDRLDLEHGRTYSLDFFFAERHRTQSNFRIQTNIILESERIPAVTAAYD